MIGQSSILQSSNLLIAEEPAPKVEVAEVKPIERSKRIPALDGLRGIAILLVVFQHFYFWVWQAPFAKYCPLADALLAKLTLVSAHGVDLFFVLSGFLITGILLDSKGKKNYFKNFYMRRILRIFPLYYGVLVLVFLAIPMIENGRLSHVPDQGLYWIFLGNMAPHIYVPGFKISHFWSLAVQEQFYLLLPILVFLMSRKVLKKLLLVVVLATPFIRLALDALGITFFMYLLPAVADQLAIGGLIAIWTREERTETKLLKLASRSWIYIIPLVLFVMLMPRRWLTPWLIPLPHSVVTMTLASGLVLTLSGPAILNRFLCGRFLAICGKYSFGMYVFHYLLITQYHAFGLHLGFLNVTPPSKLVFSFGVIAGLVGTFVISWISWHLFEKHFLKLQSHFQLYGRRVALTGDAESR